MLRTLDLLASDPSHLPFLFVFKESGVMEKYGFEIDLHIVGGAKAPTMAHRAKLALAGEIDFLSGLHHETYRERAKGEKRLTYPLKPKTTGMTGSSRCQRSKPSRT